MPPSRISTNPTITMQIDKDTAVTLSVRVADGKGPTLTRQTPHRLSARGYDNIFQKWKRRCGQGSAAIRSSWN